MNFMDAMDGRGPGSRRERAKTSKRRRIAEAAAALFQSKGYDAVATEEIAARADVAKGTVFRYAPTKARLLLLVYERRLEEAAEQAFQTLDQNGAIDQALADLFLHFLHLYDDDPDLGRRFVREVLFLPAGDQAAGYDFTSRFLARLAAAFGRWRDAGRLAPGVDPALAAQTTFALYYGTLIGWLNGQLPRELRDDTLRRTFALHCRGLLAAPGSTESASPRRQAGRRKPA